jgi:4-aminobutyrate aminotransferase
MVAADLLDTEGNFDPDLRDLIIDRAFYKGLLLIGCGKSAIRFCPPLVIDRDQIQVALEIISDLLAEIL